ncbi:MAG: ion channel [Pseudomonadota bacterium]
MLTFNSLSRFNRWLARAYAHASQLRWSFVALLGVGHVTLSYVLLQAVEERLAAPDVFWYFYITTATTVGYGDFSPTSVSGRWIVTLFVMPGSIVLFTTVLAKLIQDVTNAWRKRMKGLKDFSQMSGHLVVVGWCVQRTARIVQLIRGDASEQRDIILLAQLDENPLPDDIHFVHTSNLSASAAIQQAGVPRADFVVILGQDDNESLTTALAVGAMYTGHLVVYFEQPSYARLLRQHCPNAEAVVSLSVENLVRTAQDPGSSSVVTQLLSNLEGQTQYRVRVPPGRPTVTYGELFLLFKQRHDATLLGLADQTGKVQLNPDSATPVAAGDALYFMAARRLRGSEVDWP